MAMYGPDKRIYSCVSACKKRKYVTKTESSLQFSTPSNNDKVHFEWYLILPGCERVVVSTRKEEPQVYNSEPSNFCDLQMGNICNNHVVPGTDPINRHFMQIQTQQN